MIKEIGFYPWSDLRMFIAPAGWVRKLFKIRARVIPKFSYYELFLSLFFTAIGPISLLIAAIADFNPAVVSLSLVFQSCLIIVDTIVGTIMQLLLKKRNNAPPGRTAHKREDKETAEDAVSERRGLRALDGVACGGIKKLIIDQVLILAAFIAFMTAFRILWGPVNAVVLGIVSILPCVYLCRRILLLPLDLISGEVSQTAYFAVQQGSESLKFFKGTAYWEWKFYFGDHQILLLLVPVAAEGKEEFKIVQPPKDAKLKITYFRFSKILLEWEQV